MKDKKHKLGALKSIMEKGGDDKKKGRKGSALMVLIGMGKKDKSGAKC